MPVYAEASNNPSGAGSAVKYNRLEPMSVASGEDENMVDGHEPGGRLSQGPGKSRPRRSPTAAPPPLRSYVSIRAAASPHSCASVSGELGDSNVPGRTTP